MSPDTTERRPHASKRLRAIKDLLRSAEKRRPSKVRMARRRDLGTTRATQVPGHVRVARRRARNKVARASRKKNR